MHALPMTGLAQVAPAPMLPAAFGTARSKHVCGIHASAQQQFRFPGAHRQTVTSCSHSDNPPRPSRNARRMMCSTTGSGKWCHEHAGVASPTSIAARHQNGQATAYRQRVRDAKVWSCTLCDTRRGDARRGNFGHLRNSPGAIQKRSQRVGRRCLVGLSDAPQQGSRWQRAVLSAHPIQDRAVICSRAVAKLRCYPIYNMQLVFDAQNARRASQQNRSH